MRSVANWEFDTLLMLRDPTLAPFTGSVELAAQKFLNTDPDFWDSNSAFGEFDVIAQVESLATSVSVAVYVGDENVTAATGVQVSDLTVGVRGTYKIPLDLNEVHAEHPTATHYIVALTATGGAADVGVYLTV